MNYAPTPPTTSPIEPIKILRRIIASEMSLDDNHVVLKYQKDFIPEDKGLFVSLAYLGGKAIASNNYTVSNGPDPDAGMSEIQEVVMRHMIQIDALSFDGSARARKEEILMALRSIFSEQQQESNRMQIARILSDFADAASLEETALLNRYTTTVAVTALHRKVKPVGYYSEFQNVEVHSDA